MSLYITDENYEAVVYEGEQAGIFNDAMPRQTEVGDAGLPVFAEFVPIIPEAEWKPRIEAMTAKGLFIGQRWKSDPRADFQDGYGYCWAYSLAQAVMAVRHCETQSFVQLSPESLAELVNYQNRGYYLDRALQYAAKFGIASRATVPQHKISERQWSPDYKDDRQNYIPTEWWDLGAKNVWAETVTALLNGYGCYVGYDWWRHAVFLDGLRIGSNGRIEAHTCNSHGPGNDAWLAGSRAVPSMGSFVLRASTLAGGPSIAQFVRQGLMTVV